MPPGSVILPASKEAIVSTDSRIRNLCDAPPNPKGRYVLHWMHGAIRAHGNPALAEAIRWANELEKPLVVYAQPVLHGPQATERRAVFLFEAMRQVEERLASRGIQLAFYIPRDVSSPPSMIQRLLGDASALVSDWHPYSAFRGPLRKIAESGSLPVRLVDACHLFPRRDLEAALRENRLDEYVAEHREAASVPVEDPDPLLPSTDLKIRFKAPEWGGREITKLAEDIDVYHDAPVSADLRGGLTEARRKLSLFIDKHLANFPACTKDPAGPDGSGLSPYLASGQMNVMEVLQSIRSSEAPDSAKNAFLDRLFIDRSRAYARRAWVPQKGVESLPEAARKGLESFTFAECALPMIKVEQGETGDERFDACQSELRIRGVIHPAHRLHWGKRVLEFASSPEEGLKRYLKLERRWSLDGGSAEGHEGLLACCAALGSELPSQPDEGVTRYVEQCRELLRNNEARLAEAEERERDASRRRRRK